MKKALSFSLFATLLLGLSAFTPVKKEALLPDLTYESVSSSCRKGEIYVTVKNIGRIKSAATTLKTMGQGVDSRPCLPDFENHQDAIPALEPGASAVVTVNLKVTPECTCRLGSTPTSLYYALLIDPDDLVREENDSNNIFHQQGLGYYIYHVK